MVIACVFLWIVNGHLHGSYGYGHLGELVACVFLWIVNGHLPLAELVPVCSYG